MTQVRRVMPRKGMLKTKRPDACSLPSAETLRARDAVVVPLFPHAATAQGHTAPEVANIFADLEDLHPTDPRVAQARIRARSRMPDADLPRVDNLFADDCPDIADSVLESTVALFRASHRRPLEAARSEIRAYHLDQSHSTVGEVLHLPWPRVAAGMFGMLTLIHFAGTQAS